MDGVFSEVKLDFSGTTLLASNMLTAAKATGIMRANLSQAQRDVLQIQRSLAAARMPGLPSTGPTGGQSSADASARAKMLAGEKSDRVALAGTAAASGAFFYKATQLANPAATMRFQMAVEDTTAVIGHNMFPALNAMTERVRKVGDFLANHPSLTTAIGYGTAGLALAGTAASVYGIGRMAVRGGVSAVNDVRGLLGYGTTAADVALTAGGLAGHGGGMAGGTGNGVSRSAKAAAYLDSIRAERTAQDRVNKLQAAERASGGIGAGAHNAAALVEAEANLASIRASQLNARVPPLPNRRGGPPPLPTKRKYLGSGGEALATVPIVGALAIGSGEVVAGQIEKHGSQSSTYKAIEDSFAKFWKQTNPMGKYLFDSLFGTDPNDPANKKKSSVGAAARPAEYQDVLGSLMEMRQQIASGSTTPADQAKAVEDNTSALEKAQKAIDDLRNEIARGRDLDKRIDDQRKKEGRTTK